MRSHLHPYVVFASLVAWVMLIPAGYVASGWTGVPYNLRWRAGALIAAMLVALVHATFPPVYRWLKSSSDVTTFFMHYDAEKRVGLSHVEAMIAAGRYDDAADEMDLLLKMHGLDRGLCVLTVEHHLGRFGSPSRAESLLRRMRNEAPAQWEAFATQRLVDLYMLNTESHPKALTELRRLIARFPGSPEARGAEKCLERLKEDRSSQTTAIFGS